MILAHEILRTITGGQGSNPSEALTLSSHDAYVLRII